MKKWIAIALVAVMALSLCACADNGGNNEEKDSKVKASMLTEVQMTEKNSDGENDTMKAVLEYDKNYNLIGSKTYQNDKLVMEATYNKDMNKPLVQQEYDEDGNKTSRSECTYDEDGNCLSRKYYDDDGEISWSYVYTYDADGNVLTEKSYDEDELQYEYRYTYTTDGKIETQTSIWDGGDENWTKYTYDSHGNTLTEKSGSDDEEYSSYTYENTYNGDKLSEVKVYSGDELQEHTKYDADGNEVWSASYYNGAETNRTENTYENGKLVKTVRYSAGKESYNQTNTYNADGNLVERNFTYSDDGTARQVYDYNKTGDVISMKIYNDGELSGEYTLTYERVTVSKDVAEELKAIHSMIGI